MKIRRLPNPNRDQGHALVFVLVMGGAAILVVLGTLFWSHTNTRLTARNNQYFRSLAAAEAATEKVVAEVGTDYQNFGVALVNANLDKYRAIVPTPAEYGYWENYQFTDENGVVGQTTVDWLPLSLSPILSSRYKGLRGYAYDVRIVSKARELNGQFNVVARNRQNLELSVIAIFQFAVFYNVDLEINPSPPMTITGPVHCNANIYLQPQNSLEFASDVTAAGQIVAGKKPGDPSSRSTGPITFDALHTSGGVSLNLPIGTNNSPAAVRQILEIPPWTEPPTSLMGQSRYYNEADLVVLINNSGVTVTSGAFNGFSTSIPTNQAGYFINPNATFFNARENKTVNATDIDVAKLVQWNRTNTILRPFLPQQDIRIIYVDDLRTQSASTEAGVRLINGQSLPPQGLTVATPNPAYLKAPYNVTTNGAPVNLGTANTTQTVPASVVADAITILSPNWVDSNSAADLSQRTAADTTVNAAILAGNVGTSSGSYSGGLENLPRFLENWSGKTLTYNGSMVAMFDSQYAVAPWSGNGASIQIYSPPIRNWAFDQNYNDVTKLPPGTPQVRLLIRGAWAD